ncbi:MAG: phosphatase PAP2 family protein [Treponema sp.]|nr:phosphatase PAP2 family protein [Treponema sp.]
MKGQFVGRKVFLSLLIAVFFMLNSFFPPAYALPVVNIPEEEICAATEESSPFAISYYHDLGIAAGVVGLTVTGLVMESRVEGWDKREYFKKSSINSFDSLWYNEYRPAVDDLGTLAVVANVFALPVGIYTTQALFQNLPPLELATVGVMLAESYLAGYGIRNIIKSTVKRPRPYMYTDKWDWNSVRDGDYTLSFPSGHTTDAFMGATFLSYTFWKYYPDSKYRIPVIATSYTIALTTGLLRVASGNHFMSDVAAGAVLGTAIGFFVPFFHEKIASVKYKGQQVLAFDGQSLTATLRF